MIGESLGSDRTLFDNLLSDAVARTYKRYAIRYSNPIATFNDLWEELANWGGEERLEPTIDEAKLAASKPVDVSSRRNKESRTLNCVRAERTCERHEMQVKEFTAFGRSTHEGFQRE
jgi:hypothetical protein